MTNRSMSNGIHFIRLVAGLTRMCRERGHLEAVPCHPEATLSEIIGGFWRQKQEQKKTGLSSRWTTISYLPAGALYNLRYLQQFVPGSTVGIKQPGPRAIAPKTITITSNHGTASVKVCHARDGYHHLAWWQLWWGGRFDASVRGGRIHRALNGGDEVTMMASVVIWVLYGSIRAG